MCVHTPYKSLGTHPTSVQQAKFGRLLRLAGGEVVGVGGGGGKQVRVGEVPQGRQGRQGRVGSILRIILLSRPSHSAVHDHNRSPSSACCNTIQYNTTRACPSIRSIVPLEAARCSTRGYATLSSFRCDDNNRHQLCELIKRI